MGGATFTYYGEEIGMVGSGDDPNKRLAMYWNDGDMTAQPPGTTQIEYAYPCADDQLADEYSLLNYVKAVNQLKLEVPAIARGKSEFVLADNFQCVIKRVWNEQVCYIAINFSTTEAMEYACESGFSLAGSLTVSVDNVQTDGETAVIPPYGIAVFTEE